MGVRRSTAGRGRGGEGRGDRGGLSQGKGGLKAKQNHHRPPLESTRHYRTPGLWWPRDTFIRHGGGGAHPLVWRGRRRLLPSPRPKTSGSAMRRRRHIGGRAAMGREGGRDAWEALRRGSGPPNMDGGSDPYNSFPSRGEGEGGSFPLFPN